MWNDDLHLVPDFENQRASEIEPLAEFIKSRLIGFHASFATAADPDEKHEIVAHMTVCTASLCLLTLGYLLESQSPTEMAKELIRRTQT